MALRQATLFEHLRPCAVCRTEVDSRMIVGNGVWYEWLDNGLCHRCLALGYRIDTPTPMTDPGELLFRR